MIIDEDGIKSGLLFLRRDAQMWQLAHDFDPSESAMQLSDVHVSTSNHDHQMFVDAPDGAVFYAAIELDEIRTSATLFKTKQEADDELAHEREIEGFDDYADDPERYICVPVVKYARLLEAA